MQNLQEGHNELESVTDTVSLRYNVCFNSTTLKITTFVNESGDVVETKSVYNPLFFFFFFFFF